ncbi:MAG: hypothetical protein WCS69_02720 [Ignavibacteriaceae bacterium]|jgi:hypothetical protein
MSNKINFINSYLVSLKERTRNEKGGLQIGFDWIIYNLGITKGWTPIELPFFRSLEQTDFVTKNKAQFGIDMSFIKDSELIIFVLKDEVLNNSNWIRHNFDKDLRMASAPDLTTFEKNELKKVKIILTYNKDEDDTGIKLYENLINTFPKFIYDNVELIYERWNLTKLVDEVSNSLMTPDLLPQHLSSLLNYLCSLIKDVEFGSEEWEKIVIPNWKNYLKILFSDQVDDKRLRLIPVSLFIIDNFRDKEKTTTYSGWIDLIEWAILIAWDKVNLCEEIKLRQIVFVELWHSLYLVELERYLLFNQSIFYTEHAINSRGKVGNLSPLNDAYIAYWLIGRIGILHLGFQELFSQEEFSTNETIGKLLNRSQDWITNLFKNNPAAYRPLIDLNHIELFLVWMIYYQVSNNQAIYKWLSELESRLITRRIGHYKIPFIEGRNRYDLVAEYAATFSETKEKPSEFTDSSSYLLFMLVELMFSLDEADRDELIGKYYKHLVLGIGDDDQSLIEPNYEIDLFSWSPPDNWMERIYKEKISDGISLSTQNFHSSEDLPLVERIKSFVDWSEKTYPSNLKFNNPLSTYVLACIKNQSPLPPSFWRGSIFKPDIQKDDKN